MALTSSNTVTDIDTPANLVVIVNQAANVVQVTMGAEVRNVSGPDFVRAVGEVAGSSAAYQRSINVDDPGAEAALIVAPGTPSGILLTADAVTRRVVTQELIDAIENAINS